MPLTRRNFLLHSSAAAAALSMPGVFRQAALAAPKSDQPNGRDTILIVIELTGGNDGLNTVIPFRDPEYAKTRPTLRQPASTIKKLTDDLALHPSLAGFAELHERSKLAILQSVGYPQPNRSHFESMDIWHKATADRAQRYGWLGRANPHLLKSGAMHVGAGESPLALFGATGHAPSLTALGDYQMKLGGRDGEMKRPLIESFAATSAAAPGDLLAEVRQAAQETYRSSQRLRDVAGNYDTPVSYPATGLANRLKLIAQLIDAGVPERVYYTSLDGFDTHAAQNSTHPALLQELGDAVAAFHKDIAHHGHAGRVLTMTFSEFGRRVRENGSEGTDHGAASQMFLVGDRVQPGPLGAHPSLTDLDEGDLKHHTDFRAVYATLLDQWLGVPAEQVLGATYPPIRCFAQKT